MKKVISSLLVLSVALFVTVAKADNLTVEQAKSLGTYYMAQQTENSKLTPADLTLAYQFENPDMNANSAYVFNVKDCGWIIIAGSSVVDPVIAYSPNGSLDMDNIPDNLRWWLTRYTDVIADIQLLDAKNDYPDSEDYTTLLKEKGTGAKEQQIVLMQTFWNQGTVRNPSYNYYCPRVRGRYSVTGCVATALAQICRYYEYPVQPKGIVTNYWYNRDEDIRDTLKIKLDTVQFDYSMMPSMITNMSGTITTTMDTVKAVAWLNYCLGVAVHMDYHPDGSSASMADAIGAMQMKFKYQRGTLRMRRGNGDADTNFINTLRRHLLANDVVAMRGVSSQGSGADAGGHAWVVCGYKVENTKQYWMNWGWGGSGDGFFNLYDNNMAISYHSYNFNLDQGLLFGMVPPEDSNIHHQTLAIREVDMDNTLLGTAYPNPATLSISLPYTTKVATDMQVYGIDGRLVATRRVQPGCGTVTLRVDALPKGIYVYRMNGKSEKFIVQ